MRLVTRSRPTQPNAITQKRRRWSAALLVLFLLLAGDAQAGVRQRVEALEADLPAAVLAPAEVVGGAIQPAERLVQVPEVAALLRGEEELLLPLHRVGTLVRHVKGVGGEVTVGVLQGRVEGLVVVAELLHHPRALVQQSLLEMSK